MTHLILRNRKTAFLFLNIYIFILVKILANLIDLFLFLFLSFIVIKYQEVLIKVKGKRYTIANSSIFKYCSVMKLFGTFLFTMFELVLLH